MEVGLVTCDRLPCLAADDRLVMPALRRVGAVGRPVVWSDPAVDWDRFDLLVLRSVWDYTARYPTFLRWLDRASAIVPIVNPPSLVRWNGHKRYLLDLEREGIPIVPTVIIEAGASVDLEAVVAGTGWKAVVVKPAVSADGRETQRLGLDAIPAAQAVVDRLVKQEDVLMQPYRSAIRTGELSFVFIDGEFTHLIRKRPAEKDFRVQEKFGGRVDVCHPTPAQLQQATRVLDVLPAQPMYARVDMVPRTTTDLELVELELIEPSLYLGHCATAADRLASSLICRERPPGEVAPWAK